METKKKLEVKWIQRKVKEKEKKKKSKIIRLQFHYNHLL